MLRRAGLALVAVLASGLAGCSALQSTVISESVVAVGVDVAFTGVAPASPDATTADLAVAAATLSGFSYEDAAGASVPDASFGTMTLLSADPLEVRYTVADGLEWSDGAAIDGVDLLLDWAARAHRFAGARFGSLPDPALHGATSAQLSEDRKSLTLGFVHPDVDWAAAFRAPLPAHFAAQRAFGLERSEAAKDSVVAAIDSARDGDVADLAAIAAVWASTFDAAEAPPASGPYAVQSVEPGRVELVVDPAYDGARRPTFERLEIRTLSDPGAIVQALSIGAIDLAQVAWSESLSDALTRIGTDQAGLPAAAPSTLVGWRHRVIDHVVPAKTRLGALWNPWAWAPFVAASD